MKNISPVILWFKSIQMQFRFFDTPILHHTHKHTCTYMNTRAITFVRRPAFHFQMFIFLYSINCVCVRRLKPHVLLNSSLTLLSSDQPKVGFGRVLFCATVSLGETRRVRASERTILCQLRDWLFSKRLFLSLSFSPPPSFLLLFPSFSLCGRIKIYR